MAVPKYDALMLPVLKVAASAPIPIRKAIDQVSDLCNLTPDDRQAKIPSGQTVIRNRLQWAATYLVKAGLLSRPQRGVIQITPQGLQVLAANPEKIDEETLKQFPGFVEFVSGTKAQESSEAPDTAAITGTVGLTPEEQINSAYQEMAAALRSDLLERIVVQTPLFFERLIIDLMLAMGYGLGGGGHHLGQTNDGGVDGVIHEDSLGLDLVFLQAKRYQPGNVIGVEKIHAFVGSLVGKGAMKGVFVTTSHFSAQAKEYALRTPQRLVLIDGERLTDLMVRYKVGVRVAQTVELKRVDLDYFSEDAE